MEKSSQIAWEIFPRRRFFPLRVVPLIEVLLYDTASVTTKTRHLEKIADSQKTRFEDCRLYMVLVSFSYAWCWPHSRLHEAVDAVP
jgi:hypothetical protein